MATATQRQRQRDKKTQLHPKDKPHTLTHPGYRVTSQKHWELSWMSHDCKDWSFQDTITRKLALFHSAALPINPFAQRWKSRSVQSIRRVNLELKTKNQLFPRRYKSRSVQRTHRVNLELARASYSLYVHSESWNLQSFPRMNFNRCFGSVVSDLWS